LDLPQDGGDGFLLFLGYVDPMGVTEALLGQKGLPLGTKGAKRLFLDVSGDARLGCFVCFGGRCANPVFRGIPASSGGFDKGLP
jgi:hypothetical protein